MLIDELNKATSLKSELDNLRPLDKEAEARVMQKFRLDWNYHSNHLEGTQLTYGETKALLLFGITAQGKPLKDHIEITGHNEAIDLIYDVIKDERPLTESFIRELHTLLLKEPYYVEAVTADGQPTRRLVEIGKYKSFPNHVLTQTGETFFFATPEETPVKMRDLLDWYREQKEKPDVNRIILAAEFHYRFILIHPFDDGNGRMARLLMNFILMQFGFPPTIIKTEDKNNYLSVLQQADAGILEPFIEYIAQNLTRSLEIIVKGAKGESIEEPDDLDKELALLEQKIKGIGQGFEITRNLEVLLNLFQNSLASVLEEYIRVSRKFDKFYTNTSMIAVIDGANRHFQDFDEIFSRIMLELKDSTTEIKVHYYYKAFNQAGFDVFDYTQTIAFQLNPATYKIYDPATQMKFEKTYGEQFTEEETKKFITEVANKHKRVIERKLKEIQSLKN